MTGEIDHRIHNGDVKISKDDRSLEEKQVRREGREDLTPGSAESPSPIRTIRHAGPSRPGPGDRPR